MKRKRDNKNFKYDISFGLKNVLGCFGIIIKTKLHYKKQVLVYYCITSRPIFICIKIKPTETILMYIRPSFKLHTWATIIIYVIGDNCSHFMAILFLFFYINHQKNNGSLQMKKTDIVWYFTKGGGTPPSPPYWSLEHFRFFHGIFFVKIC